MDVSASNISERRRPGRAGDGPELTNALLFVQRRPGCMDNIKRSWGEITLATRFGVFRAKKKLERKTLGH